MPSNQWGVWYTADEDPDRPTQKNVAQVVPTPPANDPAGSTVTQLYLSTVLAIYDNGMS